MTLDTLDSVVSEAKYLGDSTKYDWVYSDGSQVLQHDDAVLLTMPANSSGTVLASTVYMWYGNVKATMKTSRGDGVVTAFILLSDVKDEIDFEFIGADLTVAQTNYYYQALPDCKCRFHPHKIGRVTALNILTSPCRYQLQEHYRPGRHVLDLPHVRD